MLKNKILEKLLAIILIFTLTFANFAFVTKSYAASFAETFFASDSDTGHENVEFEAYFGTEESKTDSVISDVNNEELSIGMKLDVKESGYLKDAKIEIAETEEGKGLNFEVGSFEEVQAQVTENQEETSNESEENVEEVQEVNNEQAEVTQETSAEGETSEQEKQIEENLEQNAEQNEENSAHEVLPEYVQSLENNVISLKQVNNSSEVKLSLPIKYKNEMYVNENKLSKDCAVIFTGIYVDDDGDEIEVSKRVNLNIAWKDQREVKLSSEATKYIDFGRGVILQTLVKVDTTTDKNTLPIKESEVVIDVPNFEGIKPSNVTVVANSTSGTNGETVGNLTFNENNWTYNADENKIILKVTNPKKNVEVNEFEDEYLKDANKEVVKEDRYFSGSGIDEYLITYTFENAKAVDGITINSNIEAKVTMFSGANEEENSNLITNNNNFEYVLQGQTGNIVSLNIENETLDVSKAYTYLNYKNSGKYEVELISKTVANISYKDIIKNIRIEDRDNLYVDKAGNSIENNDLYYKQISINKEEFTKVLGETGEIKILDISGNLISTINNETAVNEEGNIIVSFENKPSKLVFELTKPVGEGNLVINNVKAYTNASIDKANFANLSSIKTTSAMSAEYEYVETRVDVGTAEVVTNLIDTTTKANLIIDKSNLSTLANNDVELRIELNNATDVSDVYGNSVFEIELPEYVQNLVVTNASVLYGEGLDIINTEVTGRIIRVTIDGNQEGINSGVLTNGTNIVINADIKVDLYTPAKSDIIKLRYTNSEATNLDNSGYTELPINYSAPTGLVAVNSTSNYNTVGSITTSVRQGVKEDLIDIYSEAKAATMEIVVMNNNENTVSDVSILGRIPFKGVKDIETGEDLGTTLDTKLIGPIVSDERNGVAFNIYYSENGEANNDLNNSENGWTMNPTSFENIRSYLIVPQDENYEMQETAILRFTYQYEIPANLTHNENIYGTFLAYYTNNSEIAKTDEKATPDKIGLTTGEGPELNLEVSLDKETVKELEEVKAKIIATNVGNNKAENINIEYSIPKYAEYVSAESDNENLNITAENGIVKANINELEKEEKIEFTITLRAGKLPTLEEYYRGTEGFGVYEGKYMIKLQDEEGNIIKEEEIAEVPEIYIESKASITAKDLGATLTAEGNKAEITKSDFKIDIQNKSDIDEALETQKAGDEVNFSIQIENLTSEVKKNVVVTQVLPKEFSYVKSSVVGYAEDGLTSIDVAEGRYDESTRTITWNLSEIQEDASVQLKFVAKVNELDENVTKVDVETIAKVSADGTDTYESNALITSVGRPVLVVNQISENTDTYIKEGDTVKYVFTVKNEGGAVAENVRLTDVIPDGIAVRKVSYVSDGIVGNKKVSSSREVTVMANIQPNEELVVNVEAVAANLGGVQEKTVTNFATVASAEVEEQTTNSITHIVEASEKSIAASQLQSSSSSTSQGNGNIEKTYKLTGTAWLDSNKDGMRTTDEQLLSGIIVRLVDSQSGAIQTSVTTDANGTYTFSGVKNGDYLVIFEYDTVKYTVTAYKKDGVDINVNSDAVTTKLEQDGKTRNGAITEVITISNGSVSGIDIGLVLADKFDLKLDKTITKVTTQSATGTQNDEYDNVTLAKTEIAAKHLYGSVVYVEYTITVSNEGDVAGYAKQIIDYMPEGMTFNSGLEANASWYTGSDGNLYSAELAERELKPGESASVKLVLTKQVTEENIGLTNNLAEIYEDYNIYGISDINSTPANKAQGENDIGSADVIISAKTGETFIYISVIITTILLGSIVIFIAYNKIVLAKRKGGV